MCAGMGIVYNRHVHRNADKGPNMRTDMCVGMCADMGRDMCTDMYIGRHG